VDRGGRACRGGAEGAVEEAGAAGVVGPDQGAEPGRVEGELGAGVAANRVNAVASSLVAAQAGLASGRGKGFFPAVPHYRDCGQGRLGRGCPRGAGEGPSGGPVEAVVDAVGVEQGVEVTAGLGGARPGREPGRARQQRQL
jgi:hypothetical protein